MTTRNKQKPLICLDSLVFLAWFKGETDKPLAEIETVLESGRRKEIQILVSSVSRVEVLNCTKNPTAADMFSQFLRKSYVTEVSVDHRIVELGREIRERSIVENEAGRGKKIKSMDSMIAASAILYNAKELHSLDSALLAASETAVVHGLKIIEPRFLSRQKKLNFGE